MAEYVSDPQNRLTFGANVDEAMALDEYVPSMEGYEVDEALADSEIDGMQRGYAGGSLARTVFSS
jgi:hypothetical protein